MQIPNAKQLLCMLLVVLIAYPASIGAAPAATAFPRAVLGSINTYGTVHVGDVAVPTQGTLFAGDQVKTEVGAAVVQYQQGARIRMGSESVATFSPSQVQLQRGQMSFQARSADGPVFAASTLMLKPTGTNSAANVVLQDRRASVAVTEGTLSVVDPSGVELASLNAGDARLFEEASAALPPAPGAPAPQVASHTHNTWVLALAVGIAGASLGIAGILRANDADDRAEEAATAAAAAQSQAAAAQTQSDQLKAQVTTLQSSVAALQTQAQTLNSTITALQSKLASDTLALQQLAAAQAEVASILSELSGVLAQLAVASPAQVQALIAQVNSLFGRLVTATNAVNSVLSGAGQTPPPPVVPPSGSPFNP